MYLNKQALVDTKKNKYKIEAESTLTKLLNQVANEKERMTFTYNKNVFLAIVPIDDVKVIEQLEDCIDNADADDALQDKTSIPWEQVKKELEL